jgi:uncharacterized membrane protein (DUF485 family)
MNKKGQLDGLLLWGMIILIVIIGSVVVVIGSGILTWSSGTINEITSGLGMQGDTNLSRVSDSTIGVANTMIQMLQWGSGVILIFAIIAILAFSMTIRLNPNGLMLGLFLFMVIAFIISSIYISDIYQEFLTGSDEIATEMKGMGMASMILIYLPQIITVISFIGGIIIFTGMGEENQ